ncbi:hypothetical protein BJX66DRAFT_292725 [Aspergillus keveii]|uniref:Uncharacterized protein n=1 Tax=Aspergillus keveii TaxID=714993 RepID=A0ABR4GLA7_9EURO
MTSKWHVDNCNRPISRGMRGSSAKPTQAHHQVNRTQNAKEKIEMPMLVAYPFHRATRLGNTNNSVRRRRDTDKPTKSTTTLTRGQSTGTAGYACTKTWRWTCWDNRRDDRMVGLTYTFDHGHEGARTEARSPRLQLAFRSKMDNGHEERATNRSSAASISVASGLSLDTIQGWPQYQIRSCHRQRSESAQLVEHITKLWKIR